MNFPFICSNIPAAPAYGVYISQLIRYSRTCGSYQDFLDRGLLLTRKLLNQGFLLVKLKSWLGWPLWHICVTNDHGYVPLVVNTSRFFPHSWLISRFLTRLIRRVSLTWCRSYWCWGDRWLNYYYWWCRDSYWLSCHSSCHCHHHCLYHCHHCSISSAHW